MPLNLARELAQQGARGLTCVSNATGGAGKDRKPDVGLLVEQGQARKVICAFAATRVVAHEAAARAMTFRTAADTYLDQHEGA